VEVAVSNQTRLFILVFLAFLPTVALYTYANRSLTAAELRNSENELLNIADQAGWEYRRILSRTESLLGALSETEVFRRPTARCSRDLAAIMRHMEIYTAMQLIEPDGFVSCGSLAMGESLTVGDRYYHKAVMATNRFAVGDFVIGRLTGKPIVGLAYPVGGDDPAEISRVAAAYFDLDHLANTVYQMEVPSGTTLTVLDRTGRVMIRVPEGQSANGADTVGATVGEGFPLPSGDIQGPYLLRGTDLDGVDRTFAVQPLEAGGQRASGHLMIALSPDAMLRETDPVETRQLQLLAVIGLIMFALAWLFGHYTLLRDPPRGEP
jgi:hypothetical protein